MKKGTGYSYSKISLSLAIVGIRDNLHEIDMIVTPYKKYMDAVSFTYNKAADSLLGISISTTIINIDKDRYIDFISPKLKAICDFYGIYGSFEINKGVPLGCGIGGSACAIAAAIKAVEDVAQELNLEKKMSYNDMVKLGSDVPCVYINKPCRVQGVGEIINEVEDKKYYFKDYLSNSGVDTNKAYKIYDELNAVNDGPIPSNVEEAVENYRNDLEESAIRLNKSIKQELETLRASGKTAIVSGCGSAVFEISTEKIK